MRLKWTIKICLGNSKRLSPAPVVNRVVRLGKGSRKRRGESVVLLAKVTFTILHGLVRFRTILRAFS